MKNKKNKKIRSTKKEAAVQFRERKLGDILRELKEMGHPEPIPNYKATLPGPPGWWAKERPGA